MAGRTGGSRARGRHCRSCNAKITRWRRRRVDGDGNDGMGEKLSKWEVAKEPIRHLASLTHSLPRQAKERKEGKTEGEGSRRMGMGHGAEITDASPTLPHYISHVWISLILAQATCSAATETPSLIRLCQRLHSSRAVSFVPGEAEARDESTNQTSACNSVHSVIIRA